MRYLCFFFFISVLLLSSTLLYAEDSTIQKSQEALVSDTIYNSLIAYGFTPEVQPLENVLSTDFPYNIILRFSSAVESEKKLVLVFPQHTSFYFEDFVSYISIIKNSNLEFNVDVLFTANDISILHLKNIDTKVEYVPAGSNTYIQSLLSTDNIATVIISPEVNNVEETNKSGHLLFNSLVEITPGGISSTGESTIVPLSFFTTIINSFAKSNIAYIIKGYFLSLYKLNLIADDYIIGTWLENNIPTVSINLNEKNTENVFLMLNTLLTEFNYTNFSNQDRNYAYIQLLSNTFFITESMHLIFMLTVSIIVIFGFFNLSFIRGSHKHIHKTELRKTWYLVPVIVLSTGVFLYISQILVQAIIPSDSTLTLFSFVLKIILTVLFILIFSNLQYIFKLPLTGFIYAYTLSLSGALNIIIFSLLELTLVPLFVGQYIIIQVSQRMRKIVPIILCLVLMTTPYFPLVFNIVGVNEILNVESVMNASFTMNVLLAFFMLPFQLMIIRVLVRLKIWGMKIKINKKKITKQVIVIASGILFTCGLSAVFVHIYNVVMKNEVAPITKTSEGIQISANVENQFEKILQELTISSTDKVIRYYIEIESDSIIPIYDSNYPYNMLIKPFNAVFNLENYPPEPFILQFTRLANSSITCRITAWVHSDDGIKEIYTEYTLQDQT